MYYLVVGAGLSGATLAERLAAKGHRVLVIDKRDHIGGNCYDYVDEETGIRISKYGPHLFHTNDEEVWNYVNRFSRWTPYYNKVIAKITDNTYVPVPVNAETINTLFGTSLQTPEEVQSWLAKRQIEPQNKIPKNSEEVALQRVGQELYDLIFKPYTIKQWAKDPKDLEPLVLARIPVRDNWDDRYFSDRWQAIPTDGYTAMFKNMLANPLIEVRLNTAFEDVSSTEFDAIFFTGRIDQFFKHSGLPKLEYRSLDFHIKRYKNISGFVQRNSVINTPSPNIPYTRSIEYKWYPGACVSEDSHNNSIVIQETSCDCKETDEPYYPVPSAQNQELYEKYKALASKEQGVHFIGRLASYKYFNMDQAIRAALDYFNSLSL